jgi:hypothetical protein
MKSLYGSKAALTQRDVKKVPFTITHIGNTEALRAWKLERNQIEAQYEVQKAPERDARRLRAMEIVAEQDPTLTLSDTDKIQIDEHNRRGTFVNIRKQIDEANAHNEYVDKKYHSLDQVVGEPSPTIKQQVSKWLSNLWESAFRS